MAITDIYSKRKKKLELGSNEVFQYEDLPIEFRRQVIFIWISTVGKFEEYPRSEQQIQVNSLWKYVYDILARELGIFNLGRINSNPFEQCWEFLIDNKTSTDNILDLIELTFLHIEYTINQFHERYGINTDAQLPDDAVTELNHRFREHGIGYQYVDGQIIRVDSQFIHSEVVVPALVLLSGNDFQGAEEEFRNAHLHYRNREYKDTIHDLNNSFESTIKTICDNRDWIYDKKDTAKELIKIIIDKQLIPAYLRDQLGNFRQLFLSGVPTIRNELSGHGQGSVPIEVPQHIAAYTIHLTASNIVLLMEAYQASIDV